MYIHNIRIQRMNNKQRTHFVPKLCPQLYLVHAPLPSFRAERNSFPRVIPEQVCGYERLGRSVKKHNLQVRRGGTGRGTGRRGRHLAYALAYPRN